MKRKLDLNETGYKLVRWIGTLLILVPGLLTLSIAFLKIPGSLSRIFFYITRLSLLAGGVLLAFLVILILIEAIQDHVFDIWYRRNRVNKIKAQGPFYECQYCGSRRIKPDDTQCPVCGKTLHGY